MLKMAVVGITLIFCLLQTENLLTSFQHNLLAMEVYRISSRSPELTQAFSNVDLPGAQWNRGDVDCDEDYLVSLSQARLRIIAWYLYFCGDIEGAIDLLAEAAAGQNNLSASEHAHLLWNYLGAEDARSSPGASALAYSLVAKGSEYLQSENDEEARRFFEQALRFNGRVPYAHYGLGSLLARNEASREESISYLRREIEVNPQLPYSYNRLARVLFDLGRVDEAEQLCLESISKDARIPVYDVLLRIYQRREDCPRALWAADKMVERQGGDQIRKVQTLIDCGESEEALQELEQILESNPNHREARELLSDLK